MKIKHQLAIFNALTRLLIVLILWFMLPILVEKVVYNHVDNILVEKKQKFIKNLDGQEINDFIIRKDSSETFASFSMLHNDFVLLSRVTKIPKAKPTFFINETRVIEKEENQYRILQYYFVYAKTNYQLEIGSSLVEIKEFTFLIRFFILGILVVIIVITFLMDTLFIEFLLKPFYKIIDTKIRRVNEPDSFDNTPVISHSTDFRELDTVLNQMMGRISELFKKEKQFIANVSHELLTPIALLKNKFENLLQNPSLDKNAVDKIASSLRTLDLLKKVINNLLLISRIENNQYKTSEVIVLETVIDDLIVDLEDRILEKELIISKNLSASISITGNPTLLHILLYNIIVNAIKYNRKNGKIILSDGFSDGKYFLSIADSGIGMSETQLKNIFNRFTRANNEQDGHGLGLAIVDSIAHFHNITIEVISSPEEGSNFILYFPKLN